MKSLIYFSFCFLLFSCQEAPSEQRHPVAEPTFGAGETVSEEELIARLAPGLTAEPQTLAEKDRNTIINTAIENKLNIHPSSTGFFYRILREGEGETLQWGDRLQVHYKGMFLDGKEFDSSYNRGEPLEFYIGNMIPAWNDGLQLAKPGGAIEIYAPSNLAYGKEGFPDGKGGFLVPPNKILVFQVEILKKTGSTEY